MHSKRTRATKPVLRLFALAGAALVLAACGAQPSIPPGAGIQSWHENGAGGRYVVNVIAGSPAAVAAHGTIGTVLTDSDCAPDAEGLSHCHNMIALAGGATITIQDNHQMSRHRCLRPGETVRVAALGGRWIVLQTDG